MHTYHLHIKGQVQGVGFRPYVYKLANKWGLTGFVNNSNDGVRIEVNGGQRTVKQFAAALIKNAPAHSRIDSWSLRQNGDRHYERFIISRSDPGGAKEVRISPDFSMCDDCKKELADVKDRRHHYAFTTCTNCGPRYSIMTALPYDRDQTSMKHFKLCPVCEEEYLDPEDRRFYSQTNSCPDCAVTLSLISPRGVEFREDQQGIISRVVEFLKLGKIVAVKGIGGYLLCCDAQNEKVIHQLRERKRRSHKPFALLYPSLDAIEQDAYVSSDERQALSGSEAPIVVLNVRKEAIKNLALKTIAPDLDTIGVMVPYAPLLYLLSATFGRPLVATSGNQSGSPVIYRDDQAFQELFESADYILTHNRPIVTGQDDSVLRFAGSQPVLYRRSRGFAPSYFGPLPEGLEEGLLGLGAHMKGTFSLVHHGHLFVSQYLGDLEGYGSQENYTRTLNHLREVLDFHPTRILTDLHPGYFTSLLGDELAAEEGLKHFVIQHHKAHFAAVLQENAMIHQSEPVLGVIWDGAGYGEDGQIWGGEFFGYHRYQMDRLAHLNYVPHILGDEMIRQPRLSALSFGLKQPESVRGAFNEKEWILYHKLLQRNGLKTSSMGRFFDAVSSLLGFTGTTSFEGQAAMYLEALAERDTGRSTESYPIGIADENVDTHEIFDGVISDLYRGLPKERIALKFHRTLVDMVKQMAHMYGMRQIAFSGGVFQNALLVRLLNEQLAGEFSLSFHRHLPPNDENISVGQIAGYHIGLLRNGSLSGLSSIYHPYPPKPNLVCV